MSSGAEAMARGDGGLTIREANLDGDARAMVTALQRHLNPALDRRRFEWLYRQNPAGPARSWIACESRTDEVVGVCAAFPRRVQMGSSIHDGWVLGDFCVAAKYRALGPALRLQRACLEELDRGRVAFCYDFPSVGMLSLYARLGIKPAGQVVRLAKPLRIDRKVRAAAGATAARWLSPVGNAWLALRARRSARDPDLDIRAHEGPCGADFSELAEQFGGRHGPSIQRTAEHLNWRYVEHPTRQYEIVTAHRRGRLRAYAVVTREGDDAILTDLFGDYEPRVIETLVHTVADRLRRSGVITLNAPVSDTHPLVPMLEALGFRPRQRAAIVVYVGPRPLRGAVELDASGWCLTDGDRES